MRNSFFFNRIKDTPKSLKIMLWIIIATSVFSAALNKFFIQALGISGTQEIFSLSLEGTQQGYFWQPLTYLFVHPAEDGISFFFLLHLFFNLYLLWVVGSTIIQRKGLAAFLRIYFITGVAAGLIGLWIIDLTQSTALISGASPAIYAIMTAWTMLHPDLEIFFSPNMHVKVKWLVLSFLGLTLLTDLSDGFFIHFFVTTVGAIAGYLYAMMVWNLCGPFAFTHRFDRWMSSLCFQLREKISKLKRPSVKSHKGPNIYDINTGEIILEDVVEKRGQFKS